MKKFASKFAIAAILAATMSVAFAQESDPAPAPSPYPGSILTPDEVSGPDGSPLAATSSDSDVMLGGIGAGLVGLIGLGKVASRRKAKKQEGIGGA